MADDAPIGPQSGLDIGEYLTVGPDQNEIEIEQAEDGGAFVNLPGDRDESTPHDPSFYANLAEVIPEVEQEKIVTDLLRRIEEDKEARKRRDDQYEEGIRRTGLGNDAPGGAQFMGASRVVHPMMTEACIDYESRIIKEISPFSGPVKPHVLGVATTRKVERANRIAAHMNYQFTVQIKEFRSVLETTLTQVPLGGSQFIRLWYDHRLARPRVAFASIDNIYVPFNSPDFASAHRKTFADVVTAIEFQQRVNQGMYRDIGTPPPSQHPEPTKAQSASMKVEGLDESGQNLDGDREIYETMTHVEITEDMAGVLDVEEPDALYPYLISIDVTSKKMLSMYRCWERDDPAREAIETLFEFPFIPWRGAYSIGFPQIIGGLSAAATGALRALLDSAHINNAPGGFMMKGAGVSGQSRTPDIGTFAEVDIGLETDDIRKRILPFSMAQPSAVLFQLLGFVVDAARGIVRTSIDEQPADRSTPMPVGTRLSLVEEGLTVFSAIHARAHAAMNRLIGGLYRLNRLYMPKVIKVDAEGQEVLVRRADYEGPIAVQPVSQPTVYSDQQRMEQLAYIQSRMLVAPQLWDARAVELASLKLIKWPDPDSLLLPAQKPHELNAVNENLAMALGRPVSVMPEQDHLAHIQVHMDFMQSPALGSNMLIAPHFMAPALSHVAEHISYFYVSQTVETVRMASGREAHELMSNDPVLKRKFDKLLAQASQTVVPTVAQAVQGVLPILQQAMQLVKSFQPPPPPIDPAQAALQAAQAETQRRTAADQAGHQIDAAKLQGDTAAKQQQVAVAADANQARRDVAQVAAQTKLQTTQMDVDSAEAIERRKAETAAAGGQGPGHFSTGESLTGG